MRNFFVFLTILATLAVGISCSSDDPTPPKEKNIIQESGEYLGDVNKNKIGVYNLVLKTTKKTASTTSSNLPTYENVEFHLAILSDVALDAEQAALATKKYTVSTTSELYTIVAGNGKDANGKYIGSYAISTNSLGEVVESAITEGDIDFKNSGDGYVISINLKDEHKFTLEYTYSGTLNFKNRAIAYTVIEEQQTWYWGESTDTEGVAEYLFTVQGGKQTWGDLEEVGAFISEFYLLGEVEEYGMDADVKAGIYPVNTANFDRVIGTIFKADLDDENLWRLGSAAVKIAEDDGAGGFVETKHYVTGGEMVLFENAEGQVDRLIINFMLENGEMFHGRYAGIFSVVDENTLSTLEENYHTESFLGGQMTLNDQNWKNEQTNTNFWSIELFGSTLTVDGEGNLGGIGDVFELEFATDINVIDAIPVGTYPMLDTYAAGTSVMANKDIGWIGIYVGSWYFKVDFDELEYLHNAPGMKGEITISKSDDIYTVEVAMIDDARNYITAKYVGKLSIFDDRDSQSASKSFSWSQEELMNRVKKHTQNSDGSAAYNLKVKGITNAAKAL